MSRKTSPSVPDTAPLQDEASPHDARALVFDQLRVHRMPGIADGGYELAGLAAGVNIIHGPNASGKTTTARALESLLWPRAAAPARASLAARFRFDGGEWGVEVDGQSARYQRDGTGEDPPVLPPGEVRDRYQLSLHELLSTENRVFADEIVRESAGGYDVAGAARALHIREGATRRGAEAKALADARARLRDVYSEEKELQDDERKLTELSVQLEAARAASGRERLLEQAVVYAEASAKLAEAEAALAAFPEAMAHLRGDEADRLDEIRDELAEAKRALTVAEDERREAETEIEHAGLPTRGVDEEDLATLRARLELLHRLDQQITAKEGEIAAARRVSAEELRRIGEAVDEARLGELDAVGLDELANFAEEAGRVRADLHALEAQASRLTPESDGRAQAGAAAGAEPIDAERFGKGIVLLQQWLRAGTGAGPDSAQRERRLRILGAVAAALLVVAGVAAFMVGLVHVIGLVLVLVGGLLLTQIVRPAPAATDPRTAYRREYERLGLKRPRAWEPDEVAACLDRLESLRAEARRAETRAAERERLEPELEAARAEWAKLEEQRRALAHRFGAEPELEPVAFHLLANRISRWQDAENTLTGNTAQRESLRSEHEETLTRAAERLAEFGYESITDAAGLSGAIDGLGRRVERHRLAAADRRHAVARINDMRKEIDALASERQAILERCGLDDEGGTPGPAESGPRPVDPEGLIREWCSHYAAYREALSARQDAAARRQGAHEQLTLTDGYSPDLEERGAEELRAEREDAARLGATADEISKEINQIKTRLEIAREGHAVEDALAEVERCETALRELRERDVLGVVGNELLEYLQRASRDAHRPPVFRLAAKHFSTITRGRYELDFEDGTPPAFRAVDTVTGRGHALDELSSGTRVQLLLAVRLAFVERLETGARLPLIFDETLGNSDDDRARAIMEATIALAANGRQVFYFTAQPNEVGKWRGILEETDGVEWAVLDLARARRLARHEAAPALAVVSPPDSNPSPPEGMSHAEYGTALLVPGIDLFAELGSVHLWHLVEDPELLYRLLSRRLENWGALETLVAHGGEAHLGDDVDAYPRIRTAARVLEVALELARIGRGQPVDRDAIEASGAVTETFMPRVLKLLDEVEGNAARLIEAIEDGALPRFHTSRRERLQDYLEEHGYLDPREPVASAELRARVLAEAAGESGAGRLDGDAVEQIIARVLVATAPA